MGLSKDEMKQRAAAAAAKAKATLASIFEGSEPVEGRPNIEDDETLVIRAYEGKAFPYLLALISLFIPPWFLVGIPILLVTYYFSSKSGVMVTNRRLVVFRKRLKPNMYNAKEIPLKHIHEARSLRLMVDGGESWLEHLFGAGGLAITWESPATGTVISRIHGIYKPKKVEKAINEAMAVAKAN